MNGKECIQLDDVESNNKNEKASHNLFGRVVGKLHKRDENSERAKNSLLIDLLKPARYSPVSVRKGLKKKANWVFG